MPRDPNELGTRLGAYSDAITGFSFAQNVAFCLALGTHDFAESALKGGWLIPFLVLLASAFYAFMIWMCHRRQDVLLKPLVKTEKADKTTATIRIWQFLIIIIGTLMTIFGIIMTWVGNEHPPKHLWFPFVGR
jgi:cyanate permease